MPKHYQEGIDEWQGKIECDNCMNRYPNGKDRCPKCGAENYVKNDKKWNGPSGFNNDDVI